MKKPLAYLFLISLFLTACGTTVAPSQPVKPSDQVLDNSIFSEATNSGNLSRCKDILDSATKASCEQVINDKIATGQAVNSLSKDQCGKVVDERYRKDCETQVATKIDAKNVDAKRLTVEQNAVAKNDPSLCNQIADANQKASCKYNILANQAIEKQDPSLCKGIGDAASIARCEQNAKTSN